MNRDQLKRLVDSLVEHSRTLDSVVVCVGSGVSQASGIPTINEVAVSLLETHSELGWLSKDELEEFISKLNPGDLLASIGESESLHSLVEYLQLVSRQAHPNKLHRSVAKISAHTYITTNYDSLLERALSDLGVRYEAVVSGEDLWKSQAGSVRLIKLGGSIDQPLSMIQFGKYRTESDAQGALDQYMRAILTSSLVLFVGFSLQDRFFLDLYEKYGGGGQVSPDWVVLVPRGNGLLRQLWGTRGLRVIEVGNAETSAFVNLLAQRLRRPPVRRRKGMSKGQRVLIGGDWEPGTVKEIVRAVEQAGFEPVVWGEVNAAGLALVEKMEQVLSDVSAAVVMIGPDTSLASRGWRPGYRQNAVFELGLLAGRLGRDRVMVLVDRSASDLPGSLVGIQFAINDPAYPELVVQSILSWLESIDYR